MAFLRSDTNRHSRLGKNRKRLQKWRRPRGRHNKIRRKRTGYPSRVEIGFKQATATTGLIDNKQPLLVHNLAELARATSKNCIIIARIGAKKKMELLKKIDEMKLTVVNMRRSA